MATFNAIKSTKFFKGSNINKREKAASQSMTTLATTAVDLTITSVDGIDCVNVTTTAETDINLPLATENLGRCCKINLESDGGFNCLIKDAAGSTLYTLDTVQDWIEVYCNGTTWVAISGNGYA